MRKISVIAVFLVFAFLGSFLYLNNNISDNVLRMRKNHKWCITDCGGATGASNGYISSNLDCQKKCSKVQGVSCGKNIQNCCVPDQCVSHFYGDVCGQRIPVANCTSA